MANDPTPGSLQSPEAQHGWTNRVVRAFLHSNLPIVLLLLSIAIGFAAVSVTPREEDPQIVVPMADVVVSFPGHQAAEVEQHVAVPLERMLYQIDGVEYVYSMSRQDQAIITVRFAVGEDRERSLVKLFKKIDENVDLVPSGVTGWVVKPVEIDDVPIVTLTMSGTGNDSYSLRRLAEEMAARLAAVENISQAYVVGGEPRTVRVSLDPEKMRNYSVWPPDIQRAIAGANVRLKAGEFTQADTAFDVESGLALVRAGDLNDLVVGVFRGAPVFLKDVATVVDGPDEVSTYVRHGWGMARGFSHRDGTTGSLVGPPAAGDAAPGSRPAVTIALAKKKGSNAVTVAEEILAAADRLKRQIAPSDVEMVVTRNTGLNSNDKVNDLIEALAVALVLAVAVLTVALGWREGLIVALAVPVVFGLTLGVNLLAGLTINRVTLFALILSLGLLVDDPIVDVENIVRHFRLRGKASRPIVMEAVSEIRPPLITATLAVIASFLPLFFITGMMGPYMRPMALNVPVTMLMSMVVAFTITPWLSYYLLRRRYNTTAMTPTSGGSVAADPHGLGDPRGTRLYRVFSPILGLLLRTRRASWIFLAVIGVLLVLTAGMAMLRIVPLKMLPYGNKSDFQLVLDFDPEVTLERSDAAVREIEQYLASVPEITDYTSYVGLAAPMDFNGMVRHYYLRRGSNVADIQVNLVERKERSHQTHALALRMRDALTEIAVRHGARLKIVEAPPGPPVLSTVVAEVYGGESTPYTDLVAAAGAVHRRLAREPGVVDVDDMTEVPRTTWRFVPDQQKAALNGLSVDDLARMQQTLLAGTTAGTIHQAQERNPLRIELRLPRPMRSSIEELSQVFVKGKNGSMVPLAELGRWETRPADQTIYHKNLRPVMYVLAEMAGRPPADAVLDVQADRLSAAGAGPAGVEVIVPGDGKARTPSEGMQRPAPRSLHARSFLSNGGGIPWRLPEGIDVTFRGEGEWKLTLDVFRDMGLAFIAALIAIYILLVHQTGSFVIPLVVMMAIPLTIIGIMPGFWLLNVLGGGSVGGYANPTFFTATAMIGMIALAGIVTRSSIIIVDFIHLSLQQGLSLSEAIVRSCVVRLRPILLTAGVAMLSALPIATDPIFSGLAWALIFGLLASTVFTLLVIPTVYYLLYANKPGHGLPRTTD